MIVPLRERLTGGELFGLKKICGKVLSWAFETRFGAGDLWVLVLYGAVVGFGLWHHEPWSDEAYAWVMARDSDLASLLGILYHNYENHPGLQHILLFPFAKLGFPYLSQAVLNGIFAVAAVFIFLKNAALPRITKYLFIFSFYMAFEYALITRPYTLAILLIFCVAAVYPHRFRSPLVYGFLVFLLFNAEYISFALGTALLLTYGLEWYEAHRANKRILVALWIMLVAAAWVFKQGVLVPQDHYDTGSPVFLGFGYFVNALRRALFPVGPNLFIFEGLGPLITPFCILFFLAALGVLLRNATAFLGLFLTLLEFFYLFAFKRMGDLRHFGFLLVILLFGLWISRAEEGGQALQRSWKIPPVFSKEIFRKILIVLLTLCLTIELPYTVYAYILEYKRVFSGAKQMGEIIDAVDRQVQFQKNGYVIVTSSPGTTGVAAYLPGKVMWNACMERFIGYYPATQELHACRKLSWPEIFGRIERQFHDLSRILLLTTLPLPFEIAGGYRFSRIAQTDPRPFGYMYERFFLYSIQRESSKKSPG